MILAIQNQTSWRPGRRVFSGILGWLLSALCQESWGKRFIPLRPRGCAFAQRPRLPKILDARTPSTVGPVRPLASFAQRAESEPPYGSLQEKDWVALPEAPARKLRSSN